MSPDWLRRARWIGFGLVVLIASALPPLVHRVDLALLDAEFRLLRALDPQPAPDVAIVGIDDATYGAFPEPFALWHRHFGALFAALAQADPAVVGLDVNLPDRSHDAILPGLDRALLQGLLALRRTAPVVLGRTVEGDGRVRDIHTPFLTVAGRDGSAFLLLRPDADRVVRRFAETITRDGSPAPTLAGTMARHMGTEPEAGLIDYTLGAPFEYTPVHEVIALAEAGNTEELRQRFGGRPVIVGTVLPFEDRVRQPVDLTAWEDNALTPGMLVHAQTLRSLTGTGLIVDLGLPAATGLALLASLGWWIGRHPGRGLALVLGTGAGLPALATILLAQGVHLPVVAAMVAMMLAVAGRTSLESADQVIERRRLRRAFSGYVSGAVMEEIVTGRLAPGLHGERRPLVVLFADVRNFTALSENTPPEVVIDLLTGHFDVAAEAIQAQGGTVDKFMGDGIMAFFGAPNQLADPAAAAFAAARAMLDGLEAYNRTLANRYADSPVATFLPLRIGIGLHAGEGVVGNVGALARYDYTAIGDVVNTASRIEGLTKQAGYPLLVSESVARALPGIAFDSLGAQPVKGRAPIELFGWPSRQEGETP